MPLSLLRKIAVFVFIASLLSLPLPARADPCPGQNRELTPLGYQQLTVSSAAVGLTLPSTGALWMAVIVVEDNPIRYRDDGSNPTSTVGTLVQPNVAILVCKEAIGSFKAIRTASDAKLSINYYGR